MDDDLDEKTSVAVRDHLATCEPCKKLYDDFTAILENAKFEELSTDLSPNSQALWCRINNIIESEIVREEPTPVPELPRGFFARGFTFSQVGTAVICVALISSLLTIVGIRNYLEPTDDDIMGSGEP
nr:zf-HC2 domain-containing protein [Blastocatellia bacterium]